MHRSRDHDDGGFYSDQIWAIDRKYIDRQPDAELSDDPPPQHHRKQLNEKDEKIVSELKKLQLKLDREKAEAMANTDRQPENMYNDRIISDLNDARFRKQQLTDRIETERTRRSYVDVPEVAPPVRSKDRFQQCMEMMLINQTQTQNMIMNQMLLKSEDSGFCPPPYPAYPMPPYPHHMSHGYGHDHYPYHHYQHPPRCSHSPDDHHHCSHHHRQHRKKEPEPVTTKTKNPTHAPLSKPIYEATNQHSNQRMLRQLGFAAMFCSLLNKEGNQTNFVPDKEFEFDLEIKEVRTALHTKYLEETGRIWKILDRHVISFTARPFRVLMEKRNPDVSTLRLKKTAEDLCYVIENLTFSISNIMPTSGVLGNTLKSGIFQILTNNRKFPPDFFFDIDLVLISLDKNGRTNHLNDNQAALILINVFFMQGLVKTLFINPYKFKVLRAPSVTAIENLNVLASVYVYLYRRILTELAQRESNITLRPRKVDMMPIPFQLNSILQTDEDLDPLLRKVKKSLDYAEEIMLHWAMEYVRRMRIVAF